ncbi:ATPase, T2SS/T4P/T4SS family [Alicyclobacillus ferrooxydans]|uniref:ATPase, T2SS/T4P/T4SS family n=1 Tax=Alicyclobacillus ferrooxydans TaxID=471514 RepID=UPI0006D53B59|nr:ATPase, T2SS/T4P/T4SS family [Alicyclobacillus ferrooxydans]
MDKHALLAALSAPNRFLANEWLSSREHKRIRQGHHYAFDAVCKVVDRHLLTLFERNHKEYSERQSQALLGEPTAVAYFEEQISLFLREQPQYQTDDYPEYYESLPEALFQTILGFGPMSVWFKNPTESAVINGTSVLFEKTGGRKELQPFSYRSVDDVRRMIRNLESRQPYAQHNDFNPTVSIEMLDGTRVQVFDRPLVDEPYVVFRQYTMKDYTFSGQAKRRTIPDDAVRFWNILGRLPLNNVIVGPVKSGKTTFLKTIVGTRDPDLLVVTVETDSAEVRLRQAFPDRHAFIVPIVATLKQQRELVPDLLRSDAAYFVIPEVRSGELELVLESKSKGKFTLTTYHGHAAPEQIPTEFANQSLKDYPEREWNAEYRRAAKALDIVISIYEVEEGPDRGRKVVDHVYAFHWDDPTQTLHMVPLVTYRREHDDWVYNPHISETIATRLRKYNPELLETFINELETLATLHPDHTSSVTSPMYEGRSDLECESSQL